MTSAETVAEIAKGLLPPQGMPAVVTASSAGPPMSITCRFLASGETMQPLILSSASLPAVGSQGAVIPFAGRWLWLSNIANPPIGITYREALYGSLWTAKKARSVTSGTWVYQNIVTDPNLAASIGEVIQGRRPILAGGDGITQTAQEDWATLMWHDMATILGNIAAVGGTLHTAEIELYRVTFDTGPDLVSPIIYGHGHYPGNLPLVGSAPTWTVGYGPIRLPALARGETVRYPLQAAWMTAMAANTIRGVGFWAETTQDALTSWRGRFNAGIRLKWTQPTD